MTKFLSVSLLVASATIGFVGCSSGPEPAAKKEAPKPPEPVGGQMAAFRMYGVVRQWAIDAELLRLESVEIPEVKAKAGKAGAWRAVWVSPQLRQQREYTYGVVESPESYMREGVFAQQPTGYSANPQAKPFLMAALRTESTAAYEAAAKESADYIAKHPDMPIHFELSWTGQTPNAAWRVIWGPSVSRSDYSIYVDATTGLFMRRSR